MVDSAVARCLKQLKQLKQLYLTRDIIKNVWGHYTCTYKCNKDNLHNRR